MPTTAITLIGGPTALLEYAGLRIITDPTFDPPREYVEAGDTTLVKTVGPAILRKDLGRVDLVLLSHHEHKDNLDYEGLELLAGGTLTLSTAKAANDLFGGGVVGLDAFESYEIPFGDSADFSITVTAVPALHGPPGSEPLVGPVIGFILQAPGHPTIYASGDNASLPLVEQISESFPQIDVAILFAGAARVPDITGQLTLTSADAVAAARILGAPIVVGLHTEDWEHFSETRADLTAAFAGTGLLVDTPRGVRVEL